MLDALNRSERCRDLAERCRHLAAIGFPIETRNQLNQLSADGGAKFATTGGHHARSTENNSRTADRGRRGLRNRKPARGHLRKSGCRAGGFAVSRISHRTRTLRSLATSQALGRSVDSFASCARLAALHCGTLGVLTGLRVVLGTR